jgi:signal transduction histidine kinase
MVIFSNNVRGIISRLLIIGWGLASLVVTIEHLLGEDDIGEVVIGYTVPLVISSGLTAIGIWLHRQDLSDRRLWRIGVWCGGGILAMVLFETSRVLYQTIETTGVAEPFFALLHASTAGALVGVLLGVYETRIQQREQALRAERERSDRLSQALLVLQRVLRHDIRTTVTIIKGNVAVLRDADAPAEQIDRIFAQATDLEEMASKGRRIESIGEREEYERQSIPLVSQLTTEVEELESESPDAVISLSGPDSVQVSALPEIRFAFRELIENAIIHNDRDQPEVEIEVQQPPESATLDTISVQIRDNGPGIPDHELEVLEAGEETQLQHSSGIGLWTVKWIIEESHGEVTYESSTQNGSTVTLTLDFVSL